MPEERYRTEREQDLKQIRIQELGISQRALNSLMRRQVFHLSDLIQYSREQLMEFHGLGKISLKEILEKLEAINIYLE